MSHDFWKFMVHEIFGNSWSMNFLKFMVHQLFGIQCPTIFCDFGLFNRLAQAGGGGALLYDISLPKTYRPKLLAHEIILLKKSCVTFKKIFGFNFDIYNLAVRLFTGWISKRLFLNSTSKQEGMSHCNENPIFSCSRIGRPILGIYKSLIDT